MHSGICAKCQAAAVYKCVLLDDDARLQIGFLTSVVIAHYICGECGFTELYVDQGKDRERVKKKGQYVAPN